MDHQFLSTLQETLQKTTIPDSAVIKAATKRLQTEFYTNPLALPALIHTLQNHNDKQIRQLAAVEGRKLVHIQWGKVEESLKQQVRDSIVASTFHEKDKNIRHSSARVIASIASFDFAENKWTDLLAKLVSVANSSDESQKVIALFILYCILELNIPELAPSTKDFLNLFQDNIGPHNSVEVRVISLLALDCIGLYLDESDSIDAQAAAQFKSVFPAMVEVLKSVLEINDIENAKKVFDVINDFILLDDSLFGDNVYYAIDMAREIASNIHIDEEVRVYALSTLSSVLSHRKSKVSSKKLGTDLTIMCLQIASEEIDEEEELDNEDLENENEESSPNTVALSLISMLSQEMPPSQIIAPLLEALSQGLASPNKFERRGVILSLGIASPGAPDYILTHLTKILEGIVSSLQDPELIVQAAALKVLDSLTSELHEHVAEHYEKLLPLIISIIDSATKLSVYKYATGALDRLIEYMEHDAIAKYLDPLMNKLFHMLDSATTISLKSAIVSAIGSAAFASGKSFIPYFDSSIRYLEKYLSQNVKVEEMSAQEIELKALTFENISTMARAVGSEPFSKYAKPLIDASYQSLSTQSERLRESGFAFISNMAKVYGAEFSGFLDTIVPEIFKSLQQEEFQFNIEEDDEGLIDDDIDLESKFNIHSGITIEKEIAAIALAQLAEGTKKNFAPYVKPSLEILVEQIEASYGMRETAVSSLWRIVIAMYQTSDHMEYQIGVPASSYVSEEVLSIIKTARDASITQLVTEFELNMVISILDCFSEALEKAGPVVIIDNGNSSDLEKLCIELMKLLKSEHNCQLDGLEETAEEEVDGSESENLIFDSALEVLVSLSKTLGADFLKILSSFKDTIIQNCSSQSRFRRISAIGALADISSNLKAANPYTEEFLNTFTEKLQNDKSLEVRGNAAYGIGSVIESSALDLSDAYPHLLSLLNQLLDKADRRSLKTEEGDDETRDVIRRAFANACGCVSRMGLKSPDNLPLEKILPVLLDHLPLTTAFEENVPIFNFIMFLFQQNNQLVLRQIPKIVEVFEFAFVKEVERTKLIEEATLGRNEDIDRSKQFHQEGLKENVIGFLKQLESSYPSSVSSSDVLKNVIS
ncbi:Nuclear transport (karyopherin beta) [Komagataella phaffii CBS 7435]|uniref:Karyopherin beta, mediates nuclear import of ribosomal proteins n=2 Tax=Komagataella phaffii TaxID=460519 RepID=C4QX13_KOMPG|nr:uncharacterized protein PAS_chr1-1_0409 [Komagataella phaffii GS115]AOA61182.1 GQ67_02238T0 [Komagataella phaffii]CAH2446585.1 Nuclear transport (karyopherin beta) [Komagataella phaffii CBS 7435]AOA65907.1 GQ68_02252T0 [Komagataella phaffii GS115]CAY67786.1 Karyopherin beta, mediates nuclear import of ribosomal proteins [Komagataella phaffii GS115]CCA36871.1 Nuclear transport (karyopherin beta) [Komagataella phaffii CBS 7435]